MVVKYGLKVSKAKVQHFVSHYLLNMIHCTIKQILWWKRRRMNNKKKILAADDDPAILEVFTLILEDAGYEVQTTVNGQTEQIAREFLPNLILLDIWMAGMDGRNICKSLKRHKFTKNIPIIMISANKDTKKYAKEA